MRAGAAGASGAAPGGAGGGDGGAGGRLHGRPPHDEPLRLTEGCCLLPPPGTPQHLTEALSCLGSARPDSEGAGEAVISRVAGVARALAGSGVIGMDCCAVAPEPGPTTCALQTAAWTVRLVLQANSRVLRQSSTPVPGFQLRLMSYMAGAARR